MRVCDLINPITWQWRVELSESMFLPHALASDQEEIKKIPLSPSEAEDVLVWHYEKSGIFSVRSAYHMCVWQEWHGTVSYLARL